MKFRTQDFLDHVAIIRSDDVDHDTVKEIQAAGIRTEVLDPDKIACMMWSLGASGTTEEIWPKGNVYFVPIGGLLFPNPTPQPRETDPMT